MRSPGESEEYRRARDELLEAEVELRRKEEAVAAMRRELPLGGEVSDDYVFESGDGPVRMSELFADGKDTLFLYSFMFTPDERGDPLGAACPSCTSIIDAVDGAAPHLGQSINFAVVAKAPIDRIRAHAATRGWRHARLLSSAGNTYNRDYNAEAGNDQYPIATVFVRHDGKIHHFWSSELWDAPRDPGAHPRHVDFMWPVWAMLDRTPGGRGTDWNPKLEYR
jgi:predicted dithiol-disulfide oxidoreductase (DUF899 family)